MTKKTFLFFLFLLFCAAGVFAQESQLELSVTFDGKIFVSNLLDDDGSIESLDFFVLSDSSKQRYSFRHVLLGQVLPIDGSFAYAFPLQHKPIKSPFPEIDLSGFVEKPEKDAFFAGPISVFPALYYNFFDSDGTETNSRFFIYLTDESKVPDTQITPTEVFHPLSEKSLKPRMDSSSGSYFIDIEIRGVEITSAVFSYNLADSTEQKEISLSPSSGQGVFSGSIGPFTGNVVLNSQVKVFANSKEFNYFFPEKNFGVVSGGEQCQGNLLAEPVSSGSLFFQAVPFLEFSSIIIQESGEGGAPEDVSFEVVKLFDDDSEIDSVEFFVAQPGSEPVRYQYNDVTISTQFSFPVPSGSSVYYNFSDSDGSISGFNFFLPVVKENIVELPYYSLNDWSEIFTSLSMEVVPSEDCSSFKVKLSGATNGTDSGISTRYGFEEDSLPFFIEDVKANPVGAELSKRAQNTAMLQDNGFELEFGPYSETTDFYANVYAENSQGRSDKAFGLNQWVGFFSQEATPSEVCGNFEDDDGDGFIDEGCLLLPDLFFLSAEIPAFYSADSSREITLVAKNSGLVTAKDFELGIYLDDTLLMLEEIDEISASEEKTILIELPSLEGFLGPYTLKAVLDPSNLVVELNETNNEAIKEVAIGNNQFNVVLNYNETTVAGDNRMVRVFDIEGKPVLGALVKVIFPSGKTVEIVTDNDGFAGFLLSETGVYVVNVSKTGFDSFEGAFNLPKILVPTIKASYSVGETLSLVVQTDEGEIVSDYLAKIVLPTGEEQQILPNSPYVFSVGGRHSLSVYRNETKIFESEVIVLGLFESVFLLGDISERLFGNLASDPPLFIFVLIFSFIAAWFFYSKQKTILSLSPKTSRQKKLELFMRVVLTIILFLLPLLAANSFGFGAGILLAVAEVVIVLLLEFNAKRQKNPFTGLE